MSEKNGTEKLKMNQNGHAPKKKNGGVRPGAGRKKGQVGIKARTLQEVKNRIAEKANDILNAEFIEALGSYVVMKADSEGTFSRVTDEDEIVRFIQMHKGANGKMDEHIYVLTAKPGNYKSRQYLFDRAYGRPPQSVEVTADIDVGQIAREVVKALIEEDQMRPEKAIKLTAERYRLPESSLLLLDAVN